MTVRTPQQNTAKKQRQRRRVKARAHAGVELARVVEDHFDDLPGPVKEALARYRERTKPAKAAKRAPDPTPERPDPTEYSRSHQP